MKFGETINQWIGRAHREALEQRVIELEDAVSYLIDPMVETERFAADIEEMIAAEESNVVRLR